MTKTEERLLLLEDSERRNKEDISSIDTSLKSVAKSLETIDRALYNHIHHLSVVQFGSLILQCTTLIVILAEAWKYIIR